MFKFADCFIFCQNIMEIHSFWILIALVMDVKYSFDAVHEIGKTRAEGRTLSLLSQGKHEGAMTILIRFSFLIGRAILLTVPFLASYPRV